MLNRKSWILLLFMIFPIPNPAYSKQDDVKLDNLIQAIWMVESGGQHNPADGDDGKSIGPLQISYAYWFDAVEFDETIGGCYADCRKIEYAKRIVLTYWKRYAKMAIRDNNYEVLARVHNGGPKGHKKKATEKYWQKVKKVMKDYEN